MIKSKDKKIVVGIVLVVLIGVVGIKAIGFKYSGIDKKVILTTDEIIE